MTARLCAIFVGAVVSAMSVADARSVRSITVLAPRLESLGTYGLGVRLGATEAERAATLLGHTFLVVDRGAADAQVAPAAPAMATIATVAMRGESSGNCVFVTSAERTNVSSVDWHSSFARYGASELNERFEKAFAQPMSAEAWHGWIAIKAIVEAALRSDDLCEGLSRLRFDGHKGRALTFDAITRRLQHPALIVSLRDGKEIVEVEP